MSDLEKLDAVVEAIRQQFEAKNAARDAAITQSRGLIQHCANAIRAVHRHDWELAQARLAQARAAAEAMCGVVSAYPDLYHSGYTQDALKEYVEAWLIYALVRGDPLPSPEELSVEPPTYLNGLCEAASELRRQILDILRDGHSQEAERLLSAMDTIYGLLIGLDFHDSITGGLRRRVDALRAVLERTRGDVTSSLRQQALQAALADFERRLGLQELQTDSGPSLLDDEDSGVV
ncbi:MAG: haloacid dehalogenase [Anaerolineae bacterium]